jgi:uncharacterized membrane protein YbhN (UPF0104 family)
MSVLAAHLICLALVAIDLVARTWRIQWILQGLHFRISFSDMLTANAVGDAGSAITPLRVGGEPTRLAALAYCRVPLTAGLVAILIEIVVMWPVIFAAAGWLALIYAPGWWHAAAPRLAGTVRHAWPWIVALIVLSGVAWWAGRRFFPRVSHAVRRSTRRALVYGRRMPAWPLVASVPLTLAALAARVAILPVLAIALASPPSSALGPLSFASFTLVYGQLLLPTPSGAGVVELGFLGGMVGSLRGHYASILLTWRLYTTIVPVVFGLALGIRQYGRPAVMAMLRGRTALDVASAVPDQE